MPSQGPAKCSCFAKWEGGDCSSRKCPTGRAWSDVTVGIDQAHRPAPCSNKGLCHASTGTCACFNGYEGAACQRSICPNDCNGHGECLSMKFLSRFMDEGLPTYSYEANWDADKLFGCKCDRGYGGFDCNHELCPLGDDPMTTGQASEVQLLRCDKNAASGFRYTLMFQHAMTPVLTASTTATELQNALMSLPTIESVQVAFSSPGSTISTVCDGSAPVSNNVISVTFSMPHGDVPSLVLKAADGTNLDAADAADISVATDGNQLQRRDGVQFSSQRGTTESLPCSGRGNCDERTGTCMCYTGFLSSNGRGAPGDRGDCGYDEEPITSCPGIAVECSGNGRCSGHPTYQCSCEAGWTGGDCSLMTCKQGPSWFDEPSADDQAHALAECSNAGTCNRRTGTCECRLGYEGQACERNSCPGKVEPDGVCSGHGRCLSIQALAQLATTNGVLTPYTYGLNQNNGDTWDARSSFGCLCDPGFEGPGCSLRSCQSGDDVTTTGQADEVQTLACTYLGSGSISSPAFRLKFREAVSEPIASTATAVQVRQALESLDTIGVIEVRYSPGNSQACVGAPGNVITFSFKSENGDLPPLTVEGASAGFVQGQDLTFSGGLEAVEAEKGTTENDECSGRGRCNHNTGNCDCFLGFGNSDGSGGPGDRDDCGYREPYIPVDRPWGAASAHGRY